MPLQLIHTPSASDLDRQAGISAHMGMSFSPEKRADGDIADYVAAVTGFASECEQIADTPEKAARAIDEIERFRLGYLKHRNTMWAAYSRCMSPMITGPARFPVARNQKRMETYDRRVSEFLAWVEKAKRAAQRNIAKVGEPVPEVDQRESVSETFDGIEIVQNFALDRVQILFDGKPDEETRSRLKGAGWRWSPREGAWQRKLTNNALYSAKRCIGAPI